jgi:hypothetical protein
VPLGSDIVNHFKQMTFGQVPDKQVFADVNKVV